MREADRTAQFADSELPAKRTEERKKSAVRECQTSRINQRGDAAFMQRGRRKQTGFDGIRRLRPDIRLRFFLLRRNRNVDQNPRLLSLLPLGRSADGNRECEVICLPGADGLRAAVLGLERDARSGSFPLLVLEWQTRLPLLSGGFFSPGTVGLQTLVELAAPLRSRDFIRAWGILDGHRFLSGGEKCRGVTEDTKMHARSEHRATLRAYCIHRFVLRTRLGLPNAS